MNYQEFFEKAKEKGLDNVQITEIHTTDSSVEVINGKIESFDDYDNVDYQIKAEKDKKTVKTSSNYLGEEVIDQILLGIEGTDTKYEDDYLEKDKNIPANQRVEFDISKEIKELKSLEELRKKYPEVDKINSQFGESYSNTRIINSKGVDISTDKHLCYLYVDVVIKKNDEFTSFDRQILLTNKQEININEFAKDVIEKGIIQSNQEKLETKKYDIILDSPVAGRILKHLMSMASSLNIRNKVSCMENKIEEKIFSDKITIVEDPTNSNYPGYRLFDDEGTPTSKKNIVEKGILKTYLYNIKEAKMASTTSTGNAYGGIETRNMMVIPGEKSLEELISNVKDGVYITDFMGSSGTSINTVTGSVSLQIFGFLIKDGKIISGIEPSIMTTTIFELFRNVEEVGNDLIFTNEKAASPSLWIKNISIAR